MPMQSICCQALKQIIAKGFELKLLQCKQQVWSQVVVNCLIIKRKRKKKKEIWEEVSTVLLPALVTTDHVAVVVGEATDAAGDVSPVAAIL